MEADELIDPFSNLKINILDADGNHIDGDLYVKVKRSLSHSPPRFTVHFTSVAPEVQTFFETARQS
jgi:hypothetical protein